MSDSRAVLVTGGSRGIGRAIAHAFAAAGDRVAVHWGASRERAEAVLTQLPGDGHVLVQADLADADAVGRMVDEAAAALGRLDVLVNNAGVFTAHPPLETGYADWQAAWSHTLAVNLLGPANATFRALPHLIAAGGGAVHHPAHRLGIGQVGLHQQVTLAGQFAEHPLGTLLGAAPVHRHAVALRGEGVRDRAADAAGRAGDQDGTGGVLGGHAGSQPAPITTARGAPPPRPRAGRGAATATACPPRRRSRPRRSRPGGRPPAHRTPTGTPPTAPVGRRRSRRPAPRRPRSAA